MYTYTGCAKNPRLTLEKKVQAKSTQPTQMSKENAGWNPRYSRPDVIPNGRVTKAPRPATPQSVMCRRNRRMSDSVGSPNLSNRNLYAPAAAPRKIQAEAKVRCNGRN